MNLLHWIARYQALGFVVHPCCPASHYCEGRGKVPYDPDKRQHMTEWQNHGQFPLSTWERWIDLEPEINVGFLCGAPSNIIAVDIDSEEGLEKFRDLTRREERATWRYSTGRGSRLLYRRDEKDPGCALPFTDPSCEILTDGRQSVLPPSMHPSGNRYRWLGGSAPKDCILLACPSWGGGQESSAIGSITSEKEDWGELIATNTQQGARNETLTKLAGHLLAPASVPAAEVFHWLRLYSKVHCKPELDDREIKAIVTSIRNREVRQQASREQLIRKMMREDGLSRSDAELVVAEGLHCPTNGNTA